MGFSKHAFSKNSPVILKIGLLSFLYEILRFFDQLMQVHITLTPKCYSVIKIISISRTSGLKKSILLGNKFKVKTNIQILINSSLYTFIV